MDKPRYISVRLIGGEPGKADINKCRTIGVSWGSHVGPCFLHKTPNGRWILERVEYGKGPGDGVGWEVTLDEAIEELVKRYGSVPESIGVFEFLEDMSESPTPPWGGEIGWRCFRCEARNAANSELETQIIEILKKARRPLSGADIAKRTNRKNNSNLRSSLSKLVRIGQIVKLSGKSGYVAP